MGNLRFKNKTVIPGWGSLKNLERNEIGDLFSSLSNIGDLVQFIFIISVGQDEIHNIEYLKPFYLPLSYPNGKCFSIEFKRDDSIPLEIGIGLNQTFMKQNNISDLDVFFKDPLHSLGFISSKV